MSAKPDFPVAVAGAVGRAISENLFDGSPLPQRKKIAGKTAKSRLHE